MFIPIVEGKYQNKDIHMYVPKQPSKQPNKTKTKTCPNSEELVKK